MKTLKAAELPYLPQEVRALLADGVYSLYEYSSEEPLYVLLTSQRTEFYFLSSLGEIMPPTVRVASVEDLKLGPPVMVVGEHGTARANVG